MRKFLSLMVLLLPFSWQAMGQLNPGEVMFVSFNADGDDGFAIVPLVDLPANTTIFFTDNEWNGMAIGMGGAFNDTNEGELTWDSGGAIISAGTVISFSPTRTAALADVSIGTVVGGAVDNNAGDEVIYAFIGSDNTTPTTFLSAISNDGFNPTNGDLAGTGLSAGVNATEITGNEDVMVYNGPLSCNGTIADCASMIANATSWATEDGTGDQSTDGSFPDSPADNPGGFGGTALPIELVDFNGELLENGWIQLSWETASETNNSFFTLERSSDSHSWQAFTEIEGAGNSTSFIEYQAIDFSPGQGHNFYRLKQTDFDGQFEYSDVILVERGLSDGNSLMYPNPTNNLVTVTCECNTDQLKVFSSIGNDLSTEIKVLRSEVGNTILDLSNLSAGMYLVRLGGELHKIYKVAQ